MKFFFKYIIICLSLLLFHSCIKYYDKVEIPDNKTEEVKNAMIFVQNILEKSDFDTLAIKETWIQDKIESEIFLNSYEENLNKDSLSRKIREDFKIEDYYYTFRKTVYYSPDSTFRMNARNMGKNFDSFVRNVLACNEMRKLSLSERKKFSESFKVLMDNHIWSCEKDNIDNDKSIYYYQYSPSNDYYERRTVRYLFLVDMKKDSTIVLLDNKKGLFLYKNK
ncbi:hypothetical protein [Elizabethkingia anophelis]|uniref:hypothetical protein n=1 Tax=Elizabethkingia anophelis TaxID=1117645 RepID=UPI00136A2D8D|nr:hypothetical protein [Elizabethkingia anophelis]MYY44010.1 hypothetical protein [Elizabethkingia anophelis]